MTKQKIEISVLVGLLVLGAAAYFFNRTQEGGVARVSADAKFVPLSVQEPQLRLDLLAKLQQEANLRAHRNIFNATPPPPEPTKAEIEAAKRGVMVGPTQLPPPPPVQVPGEFFGYAVRPAPSGRRFAFFKNGDDVFVVAEGDKFFTNYRLLHIGNDSADVEEISSGRHARVAMVQPPAGASGDQANP